MTISIEIYEAHGSHGVSAADAKAHIEFSPSDGYDCEKLAALERDLGQFVTQRLNDAI